MRVVILQPSFLPWRGYFDLIHKADIFVFYDDVQYDKRGWRNRNKIKTVDGTEWLTVPVETVGKYLQLIKDTKIDNTQNWKRKHLNAIQYSYHKAPFYSEYIDFFNDIYSRNWDNICELDIYTTKEISRFLGINTKFIRSSEFFTEGKKTDRLINICKHLGATRYLSGPAAKDYIEDDKFENNNIILEYQEYSYPEYPQLFGKFEPHVSIVDLLFNCGSAAGEYIWKD